MARQLTPLGRFLMVVAGLSLTVYALYKTGYLQKLVDLVAPDKKAEGTVSKDDFGASSAPGATSPAATLPPLPAGSKLGRPIKVAIVTWGGYAGGIVAN